MDMRMPPGWDGLTTLERIFRVDPDIEAVICTAYSDHDWGSIAKRLGRSSRLLILKKPYDPIEVQQLADTLTHKWQLRQQDQAEKIEQLERSRADLQAIVDGSRAMISLSERDGTFRLVNNSFCERLGRPREALVGQRAAEIFGAEVATTLRDREASAWSSAEVLEHEEHDPRLPNHDLLVSRFTIGGPTPDALCTIINDLTPHKALERRLFEAQKLETIGRLAGGIAHDYNNQLMVILNYLDIVLDIVDDPDVRMMLLEVSNAGHRAAELTGQLLAFSRRRAHRAEVIDLNDVVDATWKVLDRMLGDAYEVERELGDNLPPVLADSDQLKQVLLNLCVNARDAMDSGGTITIRTTWVASPEGERVALLVSDTGVGIDPDALPRIWEPLYTTKRLKNSGLGLATVREIVTAAGGSITVESRVGRGTTFTILLPVAAEAARPQRPRPHVLDGSERVLVVDDDDKVAEISASMLQAKGYKVTASCSARAALEKLGNGDRYELLITDIDMPMMNGFELAAEAKRRVPDLAVMYMSGAVLEDPESNVDVLLKPFSAPQLLERVRVALGS
jgi:PAS domain S-box-containing protein